MDASISNDFATHSFAKCFSDKRVFLHQCLVQLFDGTYAKAHYTLNGKIIRDDWCLSSALPTFLRPFENGDSIESRELFGDDLIRL